jgi:hypothetical protein
MKKHFEQAFLGPKLGYDTDPNYESFFFPSIIPFTIYHFFLLILLISYEVNPRKFINIDDIEPTIYF